MLTDPFGTAAVDLDLEPGERVSARIGSVSSTTRAVAVVRECPVVVHVAAEDSGVALPPGPTMYGAERYLPRLLRESPCAVADPWKADFVVVPCSSFSSDIRVAAAAVERCLLRAMTNEPLWAARAERHIFAISHDLGACLAPPAMDNVTFLQHYSDVAFDDRKLEALRTYASTSRGSLGAVPALLDARLRTGQQSCYRPETTIVVPPFFGDRVSIAQWWYGRPPFPRTNLAYFRGTVEPASATAAQRESYSGGVRQALKRLTADAPGFFVNETFLTDHAEFFIEQASSVFCLAPPGWVGWSPRLYQAMAAGCIPVFFSPTDGSDATVLPFRSRIPWDAMSVRCGVTDAEIAGLPSRLQEVAADVHWMASARALLSRHWPSLATPATAQGAAGFRRTGGLVGIESGRDSVTSLVLEELGERLPGTL